jgi:hypothetical protein
MRPMLRRTLSLAAVAGFAATALAATLFGPPRITVTEVTGTPPTPGAVLQLKAEHHTDEERPEVTGRAITVRDGKRITKPLALDAAPAQGIYGVARQWDPGTPWVLVFTLRQGPNGSHGTAESLVQVDSKGAIRRIETPGGVNDRGDRYPRALKSTEIEVALKALLDGKH